MKLVEAVASVVKRIPRRVLRTGAVFLILAVLAYGSFMIWLVVNEARLIYHPTRVVALPNNVPGLHTDRVELVAKDNIRLVGWAIRTPKGDSTGAWMIYLHGNTGNIADWTERYALFTRLGINILAVDYRGFGESEGQPEEQGIYLDAEAMYDYLLDVLHVPPHRIVLYGHSLGTGVAVELASRHEPACIILEAAYRSVPDRAQELYPYVPAKWLAQNRFDSMKKIMTLTVPKLIIHATDDETIPFEHGQALYDSAASPKTMLVLKGGHSDAIFAEKERFLSTMQAFLSAQHVIPLRETPISRQNVSSN